MLWAAETALADEFMYQNVAYRPTVYKTGPSTKRNKIYFFLLDYTNRTDTVKMHFYVVSM